MIYILRCYMMLQSFNLFFWFDEIRWVNCASTFCDKQKHLVDWAWYRDNIWFSGVCPVKMKSNTKIFFETRVSTYFLQRYVFAPFLPSQLPGIHWWNFMNSPFQLLGMQLSSQTGVDPMNWVMSQQKIKNALRPNTWLLWGWILGSQSQSQLSQLTLCLHIINGYEAMIEAWNAGPSLPFISSIISLQVQFPPNWFTKHIQTPSCNLARS